MLSSNQLVMGVRIVGMLLPSHFRELHQKTRTSITCELHSRPLQARAGKLCSGCSRKFQSKPRLGWPHQSRTQAAKHLLSQDSFLVAEVSIGVCYLMHPATFRDQIIVPSSPTTCFSDASYSLLIFLSEVFSRLLLSTLMQFSTYISDDTTILLHFELRRICSLVFREIFQECRDTP